MSSWLQVNIKGDPAQMEALADVIVNITGRGVEIIDQEGDYWQLKGFLDPGQAGEAQQHVLNNYIEKLGDVNLQVEFTSLPDQDWHENWRKHFAPFRLSERIWIAPPWQPFEPGDNELAIIIHPGQAFGTGQHQSTRLCLLLLEQLAEEKRLPAAMLDVGCGTGILALAFLKLGGMRAVGIDTDPLALSAAEHNGMLNHCPNLEVSRASLQEIEETFPLVAANITAMDLISLAPLLSGRLKADGMLLCSGILNTQAEDVKNAFLKEGLSLVNESSLNEWTALLLKR